MEPREAAEQFLNPALTKTFFQINANVSIEITGWDWHGMAIFLPSGEIIIDPSEIVDDWVDYFLWYINRPDLKFRFGSCYVEFLYPGSPDYGYHLNVEYIDESELENDFEDWFDKKIGDKTKKGLNKEELFKKIKQAIEKINDLIYQGEIWLREFIKEVEARSYEIIEEEEFEDEFGDEFDDEA